MQLEFVGLISSKPVTFTDTGSGYLTDGRCFRVLATSSNVTENLSFVSLNIGFNNAGVASRRRRATSHSAVYTPVDENMIIFRFSQNVAVLPLVDPGAMLTLEDKVPPQWLNCPAVPIRVTASAGSDTAAVTWEVPDAVDNVAVLSTTASATPGSLFSIVGSPHTVTYTALDANQAGYCTFQVYVEYVPVSTTFSDTVGENYTAEVKVNSVLGVTVATHFLSGGSKTVIPSFKANMGSFTEVLFRFEAEEGDAVAFRTRTEALYAQIDFNLVWKVAGSPNAVVSLSTDVETTFEFEGFGLDSASSGVSLGAVNDLENAEVILNPQAGLLQVKGQSVTFGRGFSFTALVVRLKYPKSRTSTGELTFVQAAGSQIGFRYFYSGSSLSAASVTGFLTLLDTERPVFQTCPRNQTVSAAAGKNSTVVTWTAPIVSDNRGAPVVTSTNSSGTTYFVKARTAGGHQVVLTARDAYGNSATCSFYVLVQDTEPPKLTCVTPRNYTLAAGARTFTVPLNNLRPTVITDNVQTSGFTHTTVPSSPMSLGVGTTSVRVSVRDEWLNTGACDTSVTVRDTEPPKVTCPPDIRAPEEELTGQSTVLWSAIQNTDNVGILRLNVSAQSNTSFPVGVTVVNVTAVDTSNNTASCAFTVEVVGTPVVAGATASSSAVAGPAGGAGAAGVLLIVVLFMLYRARQAAKRPQKWEDILRS